ncbi:unnamed protein product [Lactuca virosa]|uniref:Uncharacterized protein n=1 Tax=Lactuca virosa TaxID=75947 RepID=A0AAU9LX12_9ASTR|nr:unnamed protein product [Lactuca virosa]
MHKNTVFLLAAKIKFRGFSSGHVIYLLNDAMSVKVDSTYHFGTIQRTTSSIQSSTLPTIRTMQHTISSIQSSLSSYLLQRLNFYINPYSLLPFTLHLFVPSTRQNSQTTIKLDQHIHLGGTLVSQLQLQPVDDFELTLVLDDTCLNKNSALTVFILYNLLSNPNVQPELFPYGDFLGNPIYESRQGENTRLLSISTMNYFNWNILSTLSPPKTS